MSKLDEILERADWEADGTRVGHGYEEQAKREIKSLMLELIDESTAVRNKGGSGEFRLLDEVVLRLKVEEL